MILVCGNPSDPVVALFLGQLAQSNAGYVLWNSAKFKDTRIDVDIDQEGKISGTFIYEKEKHELETITAVYLDLPDWRLLPEILANPNDTKLRRQCESVFLLLQTFIDNSSVIVIRQSDFTSYNRDLYSLVRPGAGGLIKFPDTLFSTSPEAATRFYLERSGQVIAKPMAGRAAPFQHAALHEAEPLTRLFYCPREFRELVGGEAIQVYIINGKLSAFAVDRHIENWNSYGFRGGLIDAHSMEVELGSEVEQALLGIANSTGLFFFRIDARINGDQQLYICQENPEHDISYPKPIILRSVLHTLIIALVEADNKYIPAS